MKKKLAVLSGLVFGPAVTFAATTCTGASSAGTLFNVLCTISMFLSAVIPVLIALGVVLFVWGVISYVIGDDEAAKEKGRNRMIFGIIGLAVIVGLWGLVNILGKTFGVQSGANPTTVTLPGVDLPPTP